MYHTDDSDYVIDHFHKQMEQREKRLHEIYQIRDLLEFTHGQDWFVNHVNDIFLEYGFSTTKGVSKSSIPELDDYFNNTVNTVDWVRSCWEVDNNYLKE